MTPSEVVSCLKFLLNDERSYLIEIIKESESVLGGRAEDCSLVFKFNDTIQENRFGLDEDTFLILQEVFLDELKGIKKSILSTLKQLPQDAPYQLYRLFHTLKGAAGTIGREDLSKGALLFEELYHNIHDQGRQLNKGEMAIGYLAIALIEIGTKEKKDVTDALTHVHNLVKEYENKEITICNQKGNLNTKGLKQEVKSENIKQEDFFSQEEKEVLLEVFRQESEQKLMEMEALLDELQAGNDVIYKLFRVTHTLKGSGATVGFTDFSKAAHKLEDYFEELHESGLKPSMVGLTKLYHISNLMTEYTKGANIGKELNNAVEELIHLKDEEPLKNDNNFKEIQNEEQDAASLISRYQVKVGGESLESLMIEAGRLLMGQSILKKHLSEISDILYELQNTKGTLLKYVASDRIYMSEEQRLERLFELETELRSSTSRLFQVLNKTRPVSGKLERNILDIQHLLLGLRYSSLEVLFWRLKRAARDTAYHLGKEINIELSGLSVMIDRAVLDKLSAPLLQLVRNAIVHGIEPPEERLRLGKSKYGILKIKAETTGNEVTISISDDGKGIDLERIKNILIQKELIPKNKLQLLSQEELLDAIFLHGFTTRKSVDLHAGRGVGLDMVRAHIREMGGDVLVSTKINEGTTFTIKVPVTTFIMDLLFVEVGNRVFGVPLNYVKSVFRTPEGRELLPGTRILHNRETLPVVPLQYFFNIGLPLDGSIKLWAIEASYGKRSFALTFDKIKGIRKVMIFPVSKIIKKTGFIMGSTFDLDGKLVFLLNSAYLASLARPITTRVFQPKRKIQRRPRILVCDDSASVRETIATILERAGYEPVKANDGQEALEILQEQDIDLLLTDLEMPRMDGFELIEVLKEDLSYRQLPIIVITSRSGSRNRLKAFELGVEGFLPKPVTPLTLTERIRHFVSTQEDVVKKIILFATKNFGKLNELKSMISQIPLEVWSIDRFKDLPEAVENGKTFEENAIKKALHYGKLTGLPSLADDSGLVVDALGGLPGIYSSRWAGKNATDDERILKLLKEMEGKQDRKARFVSVIAFCPDPSNPQSVITVRGELEGEIGLDPRGNYGFGYDPVFVLPDGRTLAELTPEEKNAISHRGKAFEAIVQYLMEFVTS